MRKPQRIMGLLLSLCVLLSVGALASGEASGGGSGGPEGMAMMSTVGEMADRALLAVENNDGALTVTERPEKAYAYDVDAQITDEAVSLPGVNIRCNIIDFDENLGLGLNGVTISAKDSPAVFTIGGAEELYEVNGEKYNSVVLMDAPPDEPQDRGEFAELANGAGIVFAGNKLVLDNVYAQCSGFKRSTIYMAPQAGDPDVVQPSSLVIKNSTILDLGIDQYILPGFALSKSSSRGCLLEGGGPVFVYNSDVIAETWGALSIDGGACNIYAVNSDVECLGHGYGVYSMAESEVYYYGVRSVSSQSAVTLARVGSFFSDSLENASDVALSEMTPEERAANTDIDTCVTADVGGRSLLAGGVCAITNHADMNRADYHTTCVCKNTVISTAPEDLVFHDGSRVDPTLDAEYFLTYDEGNTSETYDGIGYFELMKVYGADIFPRSGNACYEFENCEFKSSTGVLWHSMPVFDPMANGVYPEADADYYGHVLILRDLDAEGDILQEDYMRKLELTLEDCDYTGAVVSGTMAGWNSWWQELEDPTEELEAQGFDLSGYTFDRDELCQYACKYTEYGDVLGVRMHMDGDSVWTVTGDSSLYSLDLAEGAEIKAPEGKTLRIFVDVDMGNDDVFFDYTTGTEVDTLTPGTYEGVVILAAASDSAEP